MVDLLPPEVTATTSSVQIRRRRFLWGLAVTILVCLGGGAIQWLTTGLQTAQEALHRRDFKRARTAAERYLWMVPGNSTARIVAGNAYFQDDSLNPMVAADNAIRHFSQVPDDSPEGPVARLLEGRVAFLVRQEPAHAERLLRRSIELNPHQFDAHYLLWQVYNMTERFFDSEPMFREAYRLCPPDQRAYRLREWYSSQFTPLSAASQIDLMMGFRQETEVPSEEVALRRLSAFHEYEPTEPDTAAALAQWHLRNESRETALLVLEAVPDRAQARRSRFFHATYIEALIEVGQTQRATEEFSQWTGPKEGYQYYRIAGVHTQESLGQPANAVPLLQKAAEAWPGPSDWLLLNRLARCLALSGQKTASQKIQAEAKRIEGMTDLTFHQSVRQAFSQLDDPDGLEQVVQFYDSFQRTWEAGEWRAIIEDLKKRNLSQNALEASH